MAYLLSTMSFSAELLFSRSGPNLYAVISLQVSDSSLASVEPYKVPLRPAFQPV